MHPDLMLCRKFSNLTQRINRTCVGGTCSRHNRQNLLAVGLRRSKFLFQIVNVHAGKRIGFHQSDRLIAQTQQRHILLHREMGIFRTEHFDLFQVTDQTVLLNRVPLTGEEGVTRQHQPHQVTLGATAGEHTRIASLITDLSSQPFNQLHLNDGG